MRLYEITDEILNRFADCDEDFDVEELEKWESAFEHKVEACAAVVKNMMAEAGACIEESRRLRIKATQIEKRAQWIKDYIQRNLEFVGKKKVDVGIFSVRIQKSPMSVKIIDEGIVPDDYKWKFEEWRFDKKLIAEHVKSTGEVPAGIETHQGTHLRIS